jgi:hypothetical protein
MERVSVYQSSTESEPLTAISDILSENWNSDTDEYIAGHDLQPRKSRPSELVSVSIGDADENQKTTESLKNTVVRLKKTLVGLRARHRLILNSLEEGFEEKLRQLKLAHAAIQEQTHKNFEIRVSQVENVLRETQLSSKATEQIICRMSSENDTLRSRQASLLSELTEKNEYIRTLESRLHEFKVPKPILSSSQERESLLLSAFQSRLC